MPFFPIVTSASASYSRCGVCLEESRLASRGRHILAATHLELARLAEQAIVDIQTLMEQENKCYAGNGFKALEQLPGFCNGVLEFVGSSHRYSLGCKSLARAQPAPGLLRAVTELHHCSKNLWRRDR